MNLITLHGASGDSRGHVRPGSRRSVGWMKATIHPDIYTYRGVSNRTLTIKQANPHIFITGRPLQFVTAIHLNRAE